MTGNMTGPWDAPEVTSWRRLPMHAVDRRTGAASTSTALALPAAARARRAPRGRWTRLEVPGRWTMQEFEDCTGRRPAAVHQRRRCRWPDFPPHPPAANPTGVTSGRSTSRPSGRGGGSCCTWEPRRACCSPRWTGVRSGSARTPIWRPSSTSPTPSGPASGATVRLTVVKWSDASHIEDQDQWWHGGITRLRARLRDRSAAPGRCEDHARPGGRAAAGRRARCATADGACPRAGRCQRRDLDGVGELAADAEFDRAHAEDGRVSDFLGEAGCGRPRAGVRPWTAETPELHR